MSYDIQMTAIIISILIGIAMILWGLKIFKLYIIFAGLAIGALLGAVIGLLIFKSPEGTTVGVIGGALLGGLIAWPLQKLFVFLIAGFWAGLLGLAVMAAINAPVAAWVVMGLVLFVFGGSLAVYFYEYIIIGLMALSGAQTIFNAMFIPPTLYFYMKDPTELWRYLLDIYARNILALLLTIALFVCFALYFQKGAVLKRGEDDRRKAAFVRFRRFSYLFSVLAVVGYALGGTLRFNFSSMNLFGVNLLSWPLAAVVVASFASWLVFSGNRICFLPNIHLCRFLYMVLLSVFVLPLITWTLTSILFLHAVPFWYYRAFFGGTPTLVFTKWISSLLILPGLLYLVAWRDATNSSRMKHERTNPEILDQENPIDAG